MKLPVRGILWSLYVANLFFSGLEMVLFARSHNWLNLLASLLFFLAGIYNRETLKRLALPRRSRR